MLYAQSYGRNFPGYDYKPYMVLQKGSSLELLMCIQICEAVIRSETYECCMLKVVIQIRAGAAGVEKECFPGAGS